MMVGTDIRNLTAIMNETLFNVEVGGSGIASRQPICICVDPSARLSPLPPLPGDMHPLTQFICVFPKNYILPPPVPSLPLAYSNLVGISLTAPVCIQMLSINQDYTALPGDQVSVFSPCHHLSCGLAANHACRCSATC